MATLTILGEESKIASIGSVLGIIHHTCLHVINDAGIGHSNIVRSIIELGDKAEFEEGDNFILEFTDNKQKHLDTK